MSKQMQMKIDQDKELEESNLNFDYRVSLTPHKDGKEVAAYVKGRNDLITDVWRMVHRECDADDCAECPLMINGTPFCDKLEAFEWT